MPRLESDGLVGRGGMGWVYRVFDADIGRYAALKVIDDNLAAEPEVRRRFLAEAQITGQLEHPNVVPVYELALTEQGEPRYFTMKLIDGLPLAHYLDPVTVAERSEAELWRLLGIFLKVCDAVGYAHSKRVVHCDLKPDNVMVGAHGEVYVLDWGIAVRLEDDPDTPSPAVPGTPLGTYSYMSPEQAWGRMDEIDARTDVFGLGGILYKMLTGRAPYSGEDPEIVRRARAGEVLPPQHVAPDLTPAPALCAIAMRALARSRDDRYPSVGTMRADVERAMREGLSLDRKVFAAGTLILREGEPPDAAYIVVQGRCEAFRTGPSGTTTLRTMGPGDVFGEMALLSSRPRSASVVALDEVTTMVITPAALARDVHAESWLAKLLATLVERFQDLEGREPPSRR